MPALPGFVGPTYVSQSLVASPERCINRYVELLETPSAAARMALYPCPGFASFGSLAASPTRGLHEEQDRLWAVGGGSLYEVNSAGTATARTTTMATDANPATLCSSGDFSNDLMTTSGGNVYIMDLTTNVVTVPSTGNVTMGGYVDGYFLGLDVNTSTFRISELADPATWTQTAQRSAGADRWVSMFINHREVWLFGSKTSEVWYNAGTSPFPFLLYPGSFMEQGCAASFSPAALDNTVAWLGRDKGGRCVVYKAAGYNPQRISTHAIEFAIQGFTTVSDAIGWSYQDQGHSFYVLTFPTEGRTFVYDAATQMWHERLYWNTTTGAWEAYRAIYHAFAFNRHIVGDRDGSGLWEMAIDQYLDITGTPLRWLRVGPMIEAEGRWMHWKDVEFLVEPGVGLASGQGVTPLVRFRYSRDGGFTWSNFRDLPVGAMGNYDTRVMSRNMGRSRRYVPELSGSDPVPFRIMGANATIDRGAR